MLVYTLYRRFDLDTLESFAAEQATRSRRSRLFTAVTAGITESVLFQAYPIERIVAVSGSVFLAALGSWLLFTGLHYGETFSLVETLYIGVPALSMTILYVSTSSVLVVILAHATVDAVSLLDAEESAEAASGSEGNHRSEPQS
jgi:hypothetical protein